MSTKTNKTSAQRHASGKRIGGAGRKPLVAPAPGNAKATAEIARAKVAAQAAYQVGLRGGALQRAVAIAGAESVWNPNAHCLNCVPGVREDSRGLWQINVDAHPQYADENLYDPVTNARAMLAVSSGGKDWTPWSTYPAGMIAEWGKAGVALAALGYPTSSFSSTEDKTGNGPDTIQKIADGPVGNAVQGVADAATSVPHFLGLLTNPNTWLRVIYVVGGLGAITVGAFMLDHDLVEKAAGAVGVNAAGGVIGSTAAKAAGVAAL